MRHPALLSALVLLALLREPAAAQEAGGVAIDPEVLNSANVPVLTPPGFPFTHVAPGISPSGPPNVGSAASRQATHQQLVSHIRGDGGYLEGFIGGQPLAASRVPVTPDVPVVINNTPYYFDSAGGPVSVDFGTGNIVQQQVAGQPTGNVGQHQLVAVTAPSAPGAGAGSPTAPRSTTSRAHDGGTAITNGGGNTVIAGTNATAQQQVLTIAGPRRSLTPIVQQQGH